MDIVEFELQINEFKKKKPILFGLPNDCTVSNQAIYNMETKLGIKFPQSYIYVLKHLGGGYFGYTVIYSLDDKSDFYILKRTVLDKTIKRGFLPTIDLETGDLIGFTIIDNKCTEELVIWLHEENKIKKLNTDFFETLIDLGLKNNTDLLII